MSGTVTEPRPEIANILRAALLRVPGATPEGVLFQLEDTLREFTQQSCSWLQPVSMTTEEGVREYQLTAPCDGATVMWIMSATDKMSPLSLWVPPYGMNRPYDEQKTGRGQPVQIMSPSPGVIRVSPEPDGVYPIYMEVSLTADRIDAPLPPGYFTLHHEALLNGTLFRLYSIPGMPWSSMKLAEFAGKKFRAGIVTARITMQKTMVRGLQPVMFNPRPAGGIRA